MIYYDPINIWRRHSTIYYVSESDRGRFTSSYIFFLLLFIHRILRNLLLVTRRNNILSFYRLIYLDWLCMIRQYTKMWCVRVGCGCQRSYLVNLSINWEARGDYDKHDESTINNQWRMNRMAIPQMYLYDIEIAILYSWWTVKWRFWWGMMYAHICMFVVYCEFIRFTIHLYK